MTLLLMMMMKLNRFEQEGQCLAKITLMTMKMKPHDFAEYFIVDDEDDMCEDVPDDDIEIGNPMMEMCEDVSRVQW